MTDFYSKKEISLMVKIEISFKVKFPVFLLIEIYSNYKDSFYSNVSI